MPWVWAAAVVLVGLVANLVYEFWLSSFLLATLVALGIVVVCYAVYRFWPSRPPMK